MADIRTFLIPLKEKWAFILLQKLNYPRKQGLIPVGMVGDKAILVTDLSYRVRGLRSSHTMKQFFAEMNAEEDIAGLFDNLSDHLRSLEGNPSVTVDNNGVTFEGSSAGSSMTVHPHVPHLKSRHCCFVNVYVNSNVQGVNNSVVVGSEVSMRDPGVRLSTPFPLMKRRSRKSRSKVHQEPLSVPSSRFGAVLLSVIFVFLFMLLFAN